MTSRDENTGIVLFAHGSRVEEANRGVRELARQVEDVGPYSYVRAAFLELAEPSLSAAVAQAVEAGPRRMGVIPYFLTEGVHPRGDLPRLIAAGKKKYPNKAIEGGESLEGQPLIASIIPARVR